MIGELVFRNLDILPFLAVSLILVVFLKWLINRKSRRRAVLGVSSLALFKKKKLFWRRLPEILFFLGAISLIIALLEPALPLVKDKKEIKAKEIMIVLDLSASMTDIWNNSWMARRYIRSTNYLLKINVEIKYVVKLIKSRKNDALGLIVYSDNVYLTSPLNYRDHQSLASLVELFGLDVSEKRFPITGEGSTATGEALFFANDYLKEYGKSSERIIVLFTDGESNYGRDPEEAFKEIKESGYRLFVLGIGYYNHFSAQELAQFARETKGGFFAIDSESDFQKAVYSIDRLVGKNRIVVDEYIVDAPQYFYFSLVALALFVFALFLKNLHYFRDLL